MSYITQLNDIRDERDGERSGLTARIVAIFEQAIAAGELEPGAKLPPTRRLAEEAGVNHLTAARAYKQLAERGLVTSRVGSGTFVRSTAPAVTGARRVPDSIAWQRYALPESDETYGDRVLSEMHAHVTTEGLVPMSVGYPSERIFPVAELRAASEAVMREEPERALQYSDVRGERELAEEFARLSAERDAPEDPEDIVVTSGATQGLSLAMRAILAPGDVVACEDPSFMSVIRAIRAAGARVVPVPVDDDGLQVDALEALLAREEVRALAIQPRHHNPTGRDLSSGRRGQLLELARRHGFFIVEDGIYGEIRLEPGGSRSLRADAPAHVIYTDSLSKSVGGGLRAGWVAASGPVLERIVAEKRSDDIHTPVLTQLTAARYLASGAYAEQVERAREHYRRGRDILLDAVAEHLGPIAHYPAPLGGGHVWITLDTPVSEQELVDEARRQGVAYAPGGAMRIERSPELSMRLSYSYLDEASLREGVARLAAALRAVRSRPARRAAAPL
jgi:DNA-binding transcriptional MocR family regulator